MGFAIKGILSSEYAERAVQIGAAAIIVSNHGGRQLDGAIPAIDALPAISEAVGGRTELILDGSVRRGTHVVKALAMGATACTVRRPYVFRLAAGAAAGVERAFTLLREEVERDLALVGCASARSLNSSFLRKNIK